MARAPRYKFSPSYREAVLATNPVAYWRLGELAGTVARDEMGLYHGTYVGSPTLGAAGLLAGDPNTAVTFNGTTQDVTVPSAAALNPYPNFSCAAWIETTASSYQGIMGFWDGTATAGWDFILDSGNKLGGQLFGSSSISWVDRGIGPSLNDGLRHFCAMVATGTTLSFCVDGVSIGAALAGTWTYNYLPASAMAIGSRGASDLWLAGTVDEPALWDRALTDGEQADLYRIGMGR